MILRPCVQAAVLYDAHEMMRDRRERAKRGRNRNTAWVKAMEWLKSERLLRSAASEKSERASSRRGARVMRLRHR